MTEMTFLESAANHQFVVKASNEVNWRPTFMEILLRKEDLEKLLFGSEPGDEFHIANLPAGATRVRAFMRDEYLVVKYTMED